VRQSQVDGGGALQDPVATGLAYHLRHIGGHVNWLVALNTVQSIARGSADLPQAMVNLRKEVIATTQLNGSEKAEMHALLDGLQSANLYGRIALLGRVKEILSQHAEFKRLSVNVADRGR
jgi:hypothetical protein